MTDTQKRVVVERVLTQHDFDCFAKLSGDDNPIHVDADFATTSRFGRTVAHGMLLNAILRGLLDTLVPGARQLSQNLIFPAPTYADDAMRFAAEISFEDKETVTATMSSTRVVDDVVTCEGVTIMNKRAV